MSETSSTVEVTGFRAWIGSKAKMIALYGGAVAAMVTIAVGWNQLDLPTPATSSDIQTLRVQVVENSQLIMGDRWFRIKSQIRRLTAALRQDPGNRDLIDRLTRLEQQLRVVEKKLK